MVSTSVLRCPPWSHRSATHLLEAGVTLRLIQASVGPNPPTTTAISPHLTVTADALACRALTELLRAR